MDEGVKMMMCDVLVCSISQAISRVADPKELIAAVAREFDDEVIFKSWKDYFKIFSDVVCKDRKKPISQIARTDIKLCIGDIVTHLKTFEKEENIDFLMMPWDCKINPLEADSEVLARKIVEVNSNDVTEKIADMEKRIDTKNKAYFESLQIEMRTMIAEISRQQAPPLSYARAAQGPMSPPPPPSYGTSRGRSAFVKSQSGGQNLIRERSSSAKRPREDDHDQPPPTATHTGGEQVQHRSNSKTRKFQVGTLNTRDAPGRKMKSPPGDIFIYGVHTDTTEEDIVNDLRESNIIIEEKDVIKKSRPGSALNSF